jgi:hypothetical protein
MKIHSLSALAGAGALGLVMLVAGAMQVPRSPAADTALGAGPIQVAGIPDPRQMLVIREGTPYVVPQGKVLAVTALGALINGIVVALSIDGQTEMTSVANMPSACPGTINPIPPGLTAHAGSTVEVQSGGIYGRAWGYLVDS